MNVDGPRALTAAESEVLAVLLGVEFPAWMLCACRPAPATVAGGCDCGCPSVALEVPADAPLVSGFNPRLASAEGVVSPQGDGRPGEIILLVDDGRLSYLVYVFYDAPPERWPTPDRSA